MASRRPRLSRDAVLTAALTVIDEAGLEACTMRAVAAELGVEAMSLYWHVPGKEVLLDGVVEKILEEVAGELTDVEGWREGMASFAHTLRTVILRHPNAVSLIAARPLGTYAALGRMAESGMARMEAAGFDRQTTIRAGRTVTRHVLGFTLAEAALVALGPGPGSGPPPIDDVLAQIATDEPGDQFDFGLEVLLDGLEARLRRA
ncbi:MAG: TetR/AcrR family transcriptional regulator C-terminal domain-containing protein [Thermoleophilia bacterium]